ncbi:MAG: hypothetical protein ABL958_21285 [Bdellovibrionia bacterium]
MIPCVLLLGCDLFLLGILIFRQEYLFFQLIAFSQVWLLLVILPFQVRGETKVGAGYHKLRGGAIALLLGALGAGIILSAEEFWPVASNFNGDVKLLLSEYSDILPIAAAAAMGAAASATSFLRGHR